MKLTKKQQKILVDAVKYFEGEINPAEVDGRVLRTLFKDKLIIKNYAESDKRKHVFPYFDVSPKGKALVEQILKE